MFRWYTASHNSCTYTSLVLISKFPPSIAVGGQQQQRSSPEPAPSGERRERERAAGRAGRADGAHGAHRERRAADEADHAPPHLCRVGVLPLLAPPQRLQHGTLVIVYKGQHSV